MLLITKQQLLDRTRISAQLNDKQVLPFIEDAQDYDLPTLLSGKLIADIKAAPAVAPEWIETTGYLTGQYAVSGGLYYKALQDSTGELPLTGSLYWQPDYIATLRHILLPDFLVWSATARMRLELGRNETEAGLTVPTDPQGTYQPLSDKGRGEMVQLAKDKAARHREQITAFLRQYNLLQTGNGCRPYGAARSNRIAAI